MFLKACNATDVCLYRAHNFSGTQCGCMQGLFPNNAIRAMPAAEPHLAGASASAIPAEPSSKDAKPWPALQPPNHQPGSEQRSACAHVHVAANAAFSSVGDASPPSRPAMRSPPAPPSGSKHDSTESAGLRPNVVIILADDMGFSDTSPFGGEIPTPNIQRLADNGLKFANFYNMGRCTPSRASLITGLYAHQVRILVCVLLHAYGVLLWLHLRGFGSWCTHGQATHSPACMSYHSF